jgi:phage terminase large subunit-like protein
LASSRDDFGERAVRFLNNLTHTGDYSGQPFRLRPWQEEPIRKVFGTLRADGTRQYRRVFEALPRKQGKTEKVAGTALYLLLGKGQRNEQIYTAAGDTKQAGLIFRAAREMIHNDPELGELVTIYDGYKRIECPHNNSFIEVLSKTPSSKHGLGPTAVLFDEFHVIAEELVNVLTTGFAARMDPLQWLITTAGHDRESLCYDEWQYALRVASGEIEDPEYLPIIYAAGQEDDWKAEATWRKAMPALGDFCSLEFIRSECEKAIKRPRFENTFKQLYLNLWTEQATRWLSAERWALCNGRFTVAEKAGATCFGGIDLGVTGDMAAWCRIWPQDGGIDIDLHCYAPEEGIWRDEPRNAALYLRWAEAGVLTLTEGETIDHQQIEDDLVAANAETPFKLVLADRAYGQQILSRLLNLHEIPIKGIPQGAVTLNEPMVRFETLTLGGRVRHNRHPVLTWNVANANAVRKSTGLMHLDKASRTQRIDGLASVLNALRGLIDSDGADDGRSVYAERGQLGL